MSVRQQGEAFDPECRRCPRLVSYLDQSGLKFPTYFSRPVPSFGPDRPRLLIVGLAPGLHGANATGRPFTGDHAGILLYRTLHEFGFGTEPVSISADDKLRLIEARITNAVRCVPPENKPKGEEVRNCNAYLVQELNSMDPGTVVLVLGGVAHRATVSALGLKQREFGFSHGGYHWIPTDQWLVSSYHCSRYNTQTGRLTEDMFRAVFRQVRELLRQGDR